jgi:signal transduction histidine kinase
MRRAIYLALGLLLSVLALVGVREAATARTLATEREARLARERLGAFVDQWETAITDRTALWLAELGAGEDVELRERFLRANVPWFDSFYAWETNAAADSRTDAHTVVSWPVDRPDEDVAALRLDPCLARASARAGRLSATEAARDYAGCVVGRPDPVRLLAASEAAELYLNANEPAAADRVVRSLGTILQTPLHRAGERGLSARRLVVLRTQHAHALDLLGRTDLAERWMLGLILEIAGLDGPDLHEVLPLYVWPVARDLRAYGGPTLGGDDDELLARAERRLGLWQEVRDRAWIHGDVPLLSEGPRLLVDPYTEPPWVLSYARLPDGTLVGMQLDQPTLLTSFLERAPADLRSHLSVRNPEGRVLAGTAAPLQVEIPFTRLLPHLRVGLTPGAFAPGPSAARALVAQLTPIAVGIVTGVLALLALIATDRRQDRLLAQQREFMTRVTHELKTPLAGIRLMAENLELGAFRDAGQRERFAQQIVKEAERLGLRLDEVIRAAARPLEERPEATDLVAMLRQLGDRWKPLFDQQRASLVLELPEGPEWATVRPIQLRDALSNLLDNALKYRHPERPGVCTVRLRPERRWLTVEVVDNGIGVPADKRKAIFERFARVEGPGRGRAGGHGLGLAFVADAARAHHGKVECREGIDGGARFLVRIRRRS